jgi:hypothetical protein
MTSDLLLAPPTLLVALAGTATAAWSVEWVVAWFVTWLVAWATAGTTRTLAAMDAAPSTPKVRMGSPPLRGFCGWLHVAVTLRPTTSHDFSETHGKKRE